MIYTRFGDDIGCHFSHHAHLAKLPALIKPIRLASCLLVELLPTNVLYSTSTPRLITLAVEIWQWTPTWASCSINALLLIMLFFPILALALTSAWCIISVPSPICAGRDT